MRMLSHENNKVIFDLFRSSRLTHASDISEMTGNQCLRLDELVCTLSLSLRSLSLCYFLFTRVDTFDSFIICCPLLSVRKL